MKLGQIIRRLRRAPLRYQAWRALRALNSIRIGYPPATLLSMMRGCKRLSVAARACGVTCADLAQAFKA